MRFSNPNLAAALEQNARGWTPKRHGAALQFWLRGDSRTLNGATVSQATDLSSYGRNFSQGTASAQPAYNATGIAGRPCFVFDGVNDLLVGPSMVSVTTSGVLFVVVQIDADPPSSGFGGCWQFGGPNGSENYLPNFADGKIYIGDMSSRKSTNVAKGTGWFQTRRIVEVVSAANDYRLLLNGVEEYTTNSSTFSMAGNVAIGGHATGGSVFLKGRIAEAFLVSPLPTAALRLKDRQYLAKRYTITL